MADKSFFTAEPQGTLSFFTPPPPSAGGQPVAVRHSNGTGTDGLVYLLGDHLGSTSLTADPVDGDKLTELRYRPWGETRYSLGSTATDRRYTGQTEENQGGLGLYFYNARFYDPSLGRFTSPDTIVPGAGNPQAWDRYAYANNNALKYIDPSGHDAWWCSDASCRSSYYSGMMGAWRYYYRRPIYRPTITPSPTSIPAPTIITRAEWGALPPGSGGSNGEGLYGPDNPNGYMLYPGSLAETYKKITIHHEGDDATYNVKRVQKNEMDGGLYDIGYHFIVGPDGKIYEGRDINARGAHAIPNTGNIGILWLGDFNPGFDMSDPYGRYGTPDTTDDVYGPTPLQFEATVNLVIWLDYQYGINELFGHRELESTACPGDYAMPYVDQLKGLIR